ncbi:hypothetical protein DVH24_012863 [Malus domestica]|uniref:DUF620 domain-containing protein n=1 Tax=Malus domestica TaxID=3750 RepID=A0A498HQQ4_MALDO|nr:hypothetical protein DVH24_012863 [Malus domestica]
MRKLCPNLDKEDGLDTVLEVPIPEEMFTSMGSNVVLRLANLCSFMKDQSHVEKNSRSSHPSSGSNNEFMALLKLVGSPLIPLQVDCDSALSRPIKDCSIEGSTAKYIVQQYGAATGGLAALKSVNSMYAVGEVKMVGSEMRQGDDSVHVQSKVNSEVGGFVLWQKNPDLWYLELVVSGLKVSAGSDGKVVWNQSGSQPCRANKGPPRPLRRFFQGLGPRSTANLFLDAMCTGEKNINKEECFILKLKTPTEILQSQSTPQTEIVHHTIWGYFSQRTGLLIQFEDTKLVKMRSRNDDVSGRRRWRRYVDGINIAHGGKTSALLYRYGHAYNQKRRIGETWKIDEVDFNICGLSMDCFLPPADLKREDGGGDQ